MTDLPAPGNRGDRRDGASVMQASAETAAEKSRRRVRLGSPRLTAGERRWLLLVLDLLVLNLALLAVLAVRDNYRFALATLAQVPVYFAILSVLWVVWALFLDCYNLPRSADASQGSWTAALAALLTALSYLAVPFYTPYFTSSRLSVLLWIGLATVSVVLWRAAYATVFSQPQFHQRLLVVGAGRSGAELARELAGKPLFGNPFAGSGVFVVGFVDDDPAKAGAVVEGVPVLGNRSDLARLTREHRVDTLVLAITHAPNIHPDLFQVLLDCREQGIRLEPMTSVYERLTGRVSVAHAGRNLHVVLPLDDVPLQRVFWAVKRLGDLLVGLLGLVGVGLLALPVALTNWATGPGPLFYWQMRLGKGGRPFRLIKFRTMIPDAEREGGAVWARKGDPRVTAAGRVLRRTRLDELPQFWNVLRGEMSLIGPRPERPEFVAELAKRVPFYQARHAVRPGITGWAQVRHGYGDSEEDALVKLQYDLYYIKHPSLYLELSILAKTLPVMLGLRGR